MSKDITTNLFKDVSNLIDDVKTNLAHYANSALVIMYWRIGQRINQDIGEHKNVVGNLAII